MGGEVTRSPLARLDLVEIWTFIAADSERAADRMLDRIGEAAGILAVNPAAGRARPELGDGIRSFPVGAYVIFYRMAVDGIDIVRVLAGYRDIGHGDFEGGPT
ncbi:type II toxin-antitoxin system RelE/ParE family toxin [Xanthobacter autotrophicus]|uniref:type II toxin-antitoxin system RelE/ParE family toxin n=1 Tax=Xanthobacter autotrophicus TaxID=280 RepID=UPI003729F8FC